MNGPVPQFMAPDHSSSGLVLHEMTSDQIRSDLSPNRQETSVDNISSDLVSNKQKASDYDISGPCKQDNKLATDPEMCMFALSVSTEEPKNSKEAMADSAWIEAMQDKLH
ncbi:hypothetical protein Tco_1421002 [Tanacetum coccineum]